MNNNKFKTPFSEKISIAKSVLTALFGLATLAISYVASFVPAMILSGVVMAGALSGVSFKLAKNISKKRNYKKLLENYNKSVPKIEKDMEDRLNPELLKEFEESAKNNIDKTNKSKIVIKNNKEIER